MPARVQRFEIVLTERARIAVRRERREGEDDRYAVILVVDEDGEAHTVRVYDNAHGHNEMHRYTRSGGKQPAEASFGGYAREALPLAIEALRYGFEEMIDAWRR